MQLISKIYIPYKSCNTKFINEGTVYINNGKNKRANNACITIYLKRQEMRSRGENIEDYMNILDDEECLRIEIKGKRLSLRREAKKDRKMLINRINLFNNILSNYDPVSELNRYLGIKCGENRYIVKYKEDPILKDMPLKPTTLEDVLSRKYEVRNLIEILKSLQLDKRAVSKGALNNLIQNDTTIFNSKATKITAKRVVRFLNGEDKSTSLSKATINSYSKKILSMGVRYLFSDVNLEPITIGELIDAIDGDGRIDKRCHNTPILTP